MVQTEKFVSGSGAEADLLEKTGALLWGDFTLASGKKSNYYFDSKLLTLDPRGAAYVSSRLFKKLKAEGISHVGGTAYGAIPIVAQIALLSGLEGNFPISAFYHRKTNDIKSHGTEATAEGIIPKTPGTHVAILEDVVTTGDSLLAAIQRAEEEHLVVTHAMVLLDRGEGGREMIEKRGYKFWSVLSVSRSPDGTVRIVQNDS